MVDISEARMTLAQVGSLAKVAGRDVNRMALLLRRLETESGTAEKDRLDIGRLRHRAELLIRVIYG